MPLSRQPACFHIQVRNLRIREDTAKYLFNLAENSPYYDPKSRSMRENPFANVQGKEKEAARFAGENFIRYVSLNLCPTFSLRFPKKLGRQGNC